MIFSIYNLFQFHSPRKFHCTGWLSFFCFFTTINNSYLINRFHTFFSNGNILNKLLYSVLYPFSNKILTYFEIHLISVRDSFHFFFLPSTIIIFCLVILILFTNILHHLNFYQSCSLDNSISMSNVVVPLFSDGTQQSTTQTNV